MPIHTPNTLPFVAVGCVILGLIANLSAGADVFKALEAWISVFFLLTMVTNVLCSGKFLHSRQIKDTSSAYTSTGAIALRIFVTRSPLRSLTTVWLAALVIVESSTLYALSVIAALTTFLSSSDGQYPAMDTIVLLVVSREPFVSHFCPLLTSAFTLERFDYSSDLFLCHSLDRFAKR
jgi:hypothetical protein